MAECFYCGIEYSKERLMQVRYDKTNEPVLLCPVCIMKGTSGADLIEDWD